MSELGLKVSSIFVGYTVRNCCHFNVIKGTTATFSCEDVYYAPQGGFNFCVGYEFANATIRIKAT